MKVNNFKWNEITSLFEHAKSIGLNPTLMVVSNKPYERYKFIWLKLQIRDSRLISRIYDRKWLTPRIKHYIDFNNKCPYGEIRVIER